MFITISHQKGGVGKSTIAWNLAIEMSKMRPTIVVDLDVQNTFSQSYKLRQKLLAKTEDKQVLKSLQNLKLVKITSKEELVDFYKNTNRNALHITDTGGFDHDVNRVAIAMSSLLITPVSTKFYELLGLKKYEEILSALSKIMGRDIIASVVFNKINPNAKHMQDVFSFVNKSPHFSQFTSIIRQRGDFENSPAQGMSVNEYNPEGKAAREIRAFIDEILSSAEEIKKVG
jgi:chromosome partitioning protein